MIECLGLSKQYKKDTWALRNVNLTIRTGMFGLLGPNGAGKTTLIRILSALQQPTEGQVRFQGVPVQKNPDALRAQMGYLPQFFQVYPHLSGYEFLEYVAVMKGMTHRQQRQVAIERLLKQVNLTADAYKKVKTYSGGMKQRLGIAQALLNDPQVVIVDEPTAGLDPEERVRFRNLLAQFSLQRTVILSTHIVADIESSCRQVAVLNKGMLALSGDLKQLQLQAEGRVWEAEVTEQQYASIHHLPVVSARRVDHDYQVRVICDEPPFPQAHPVAPSLEDGYLSLIGGGRSV